jgi:hypothetical protein
MLTGAGIASSAFNSGGNINNDAFRNNMSMFNSQMQGISGLFNGIGTFASSKLGQDALGNFGKNLSDWWNKPSGSGVIEAANGGSMEHAPGLIHGPGGPRDDVVPAMLSRGEFVLNEGAVKHFGLAKLNKMNEVGLNNQAARGLIRRA